MALPWLDPKVIEFPDIETALKEPEGLLAAGGALTTDWLLEAYQRGIFPWYEAGQPILWWSPDPRLVLFPKRLRISRSLRKSINNNPYQFYINKDFRTVIESCGAQRVTSPGTWITPEMADAYLKLHEQGFAHSFEVWREDELAGGLYGVALGKIFFGESMFSRESNTSKLALVGLVSKMAQWQFEVIDCQISSEHLKALGAEEIPRHEFSGFLSRYCNGESAIQWPQNEEIQLGNNQTCSQIQRT